LREAEPVTIYLPAAQMLDGVANYYVRTASDPAAIGPAIRAAVREIDPMLPSSICTRSSSSNAAIRRNACSHSCRASSAWPRCCWRVWASMD
jgi:hypothetical protein